MARGFTLIETAMATVIIGVGVVAIVEAQQHFMQSNAWSSQAATGTFLANEIREFTHNLPRHDPVTGLSINGGALSGWGPESGEVTVDDIDDIDDIDGLTFGEAGDYPGPINAFGEIIPEINADGEVVVDEYGNELSMQGWVQTVIVEKLDAFDSGTVIDDDAFDAPSGSFEGRDVDEFPLRVTVIVSYQGPYDALPAEVTRVEWIVP